MSHTYSYPRPSVTVDCVVFGVDGADLQVLVVERADPPFQQQWALPGGFVSVSDGADQGESLEAAARRELAEETGVDAGYLEQLYTFGNPGRDPRGRVISVAYMALVRSREHVAKAGSDARRAQWRPVAAMLSERLAFDHSDILAMALARLQAKVRYAPIGFRLLPERFTLPELQTVYEAALQRPLDRGNFRRTLLALGVLQKVGRQQGAPGKPPDVYRFDKRAYDRAEKAGWYFDPVPRKPLKTKDRKRS
jgi:8-oxo-dGTP diphosphatase